MNRAIKKIKTPLLFLPPGPKLLFGLRPSAGFTLVELMIAMLFVSIGFFGYVALHARILHSGQRLEEREMVRSATGFLEAIDIGRAMKGNQLSISGETYQVSHYSQKVMRLTTLPAPNIEAWADNFPPEFHQGLEQTYELSPFVRAKPYEYSWKTR